MPVVSVIINVYKNYKALLIILKALELQSFKDFEVIISEDNNAEELLNILKNNTFQLSIKHISQPDAGFRKCAALNKAIKASDADYIIFLDGDCVPHKHFVKQHYHSQIPRTALFGRRVMLTQKLTEKVYNKPGLLNNPFLFIILWWYGCKRKDAGLYIPFMPFVKKVSIWGCNWSINKSILYEVGGFDEQYTKPGIGEDVDITHRMLQKGITIYQIKHRVIQYHLWHKENYTDTKEVEAILQRKMDRNNWELPVNYLA